MARNGEGSKRPPVTAGMLLSGAVVLLALPSAVLAFSSGFGPRVVTADTTETIPGSRLTAHLSPSLAVFSLGKGQMFRFTPAGNASRPDRSVTVAVRVDPMIARGLLARSAHPANTANAAGANLVQIAPTSFNLGVSHGYHSFAQAIVPPGEGRKADLPELAQIETATPEASDPSRFSPRIVLDEKVATGRAPRTFSGSADMVDVGGAYRLGRNIDVTAGVRYSQERDRLRPLTDGQKDSQAVYVGTQFHF